MKGTNHQGAHHITPPIVFVKTLVALFILMVLTVAVAWLPDSYPQTFGWVLETRQGSYIANFLNMGIATLKALLVVSFFMAVKNASSLVKLYAITGFAWFTLMFIILADYGTRRFEPDVRRRVPIAVTLRRVPRACLSARRRARVVGRRHDPARG